MIKENAAGDKKSTAIDGRIENSFERLYTVAQVARILVRDPSTITRWCQLFAATGKFGLRAVRLGGGWRVRRGDVEKAIERGVQLPRKRGRPRKKKVLE